MQTESTGAAPAMTETSSLADAGTLEALHSRLARELRRCSSFIDCARLAITSTQLYECDEAGDLLLEVKNRLDKAAGTLDLVQEKGGTALARNPSPRRQKSTDSRRRAISALSRTDCMI